MDFIKEVILTFSEYDKEEFIHFLARKRPVAARKDVEVFKILFTSYLNDNKIGNQFKGQQNYHAVRKRIAKELENYLMLKSAKLKRFQKESRLMMVQYFINLNKYEIAWELLLKEEKEALQSKNTFINVLVQRMKLQILPYYASNEFEDTQQKLLKLQKEQLIEDQFQLYFIQVQSELKNKLMDGEVSFAGNLIKETLAKYELLKDVALSPKTHLKIVEIIRTEFLISRKHYLLVNALSEYYQNIVYQFTSKLNLEPELARLEYIMAHAYFHIRNFEKANNHLTNVYELMKKNEDVKATYLVRHLSLDCSIKVFSGHIVNAIEEHEKYFITKSYKSSEKEHLNLSLNLVAYYCTVEDFSKANRILIYMNKSAAYYQRNMGREWLIRKDMIRVITQLEIGNVEICLGILKGIKKQHKEMLKADEYRFAINFVDFVISYLNDPLNVSLKELDELFTQFNLSKAKIFEDPKLLSFYSWMKSRLLNKNVYTILLEEYNDTKH